MTQFCVAIMLITLVDIYATGQPYVLYWPIAPDDLLTHVHGDVRDDQLGEHGHLLATAVRTLPVGPVAARALPPLLGEAATVRPAPERPPSDSERSTRTDASTARALLAATTLISDRPGADQILRDSSANGRGPQLTLVDFDRYGASGGLMTALAFIDALGEGDLTAGRSIAGTGEITGTGQVLEILSLPQKVVGAHEAGAEVFLVPATNLLGWDEPSYPDLTIVAVSDLAEAVDWLCATGASDEVCFPADIDRPRVIEPVWQTHNLVRRSQSRWPHAPVMTCRTTRCCTKRLRDCTTTRSTPPSVPM